MSMKYCIVLALVLAVTSASNLRRTEKTAKREEVVAMVNALAVKYDCHQQQDNLKDTLATITSKNELAERKANADFATSKTDIEETKRKADSEATLTKTAADNAAALAFAQQTTQANKELAAAIKILADADAAAEVAADAACKIVTTASVSWDQAETTYQAAKALHPLEVARLAKEKKYELELAQTVYNGKIHADDIAHSAGIDAAKKAYKASTEICKSTEKATTEQIASDDRTVKDIAVLVGSLEMCEKTGTNPPAATPADPAATSLLEVASCAEIKAQVMRFKRVFEPRQCTVFAKGVVEQAKVTEQCAKQYCSSDVHCRSKKCEGGQCEDEPLPTPPIMPTTKVSDVADMQRRLAEYTAKASADHTACVRDAETTQGNTLSALRAESSKVSSEADLVRSAAQTAADKNWNDAKKVVDKNWIDAKKAYEAHLKIKNAKTEACMTARATHDSAQTRNQEESAKLNKHHSEVSIPKFKATKKAFVATAETALTLAKATSQAVQVSEITSATAARDTELARLTVEKNTILDVNHALGKLTVVHQKIEPAPTTGPTTLPDTTKPTADPVH